MAEFNLTSSVCSDNDFWTENQIISLLLVNGFRTFVSLLSLTANGLLFCSSVNTKAIHTNTRILLCTFAGGSLLLSMGNIINALYSYVAYFSNGVQGWCIDWLACQLGIVSIEMIGATLSYSTPIVIGIERMYATVYHSSYEHTSPKLGIVLSASACSFALIACGINLIPGGQTSDDPTVPYCVAIDPRDGPYRTLVNWGMVGISQLVSLSFSYGALKSARYKLTTFVLNTARLSLSSRLQLKHSVWITKTILPAVSLITCSILLSLICITIEAIFGSFSVQDLNIFIHFTIYCMTALSTFGSAVVCLRRNALLKKAAKRIIGKVFVCCDLENAVDPLTNRSDYINHFELLNNFWMSSVPRK